MEPQYRNLPKLSIKNGLWIAAGLILLLVYYLIDPTESGFMPKCVFHQLTGLDCMGCGSQRMLHHLLHGDIKAAFEANAFLVISLPFLVFLVWVELNRLKYPRLYGIVHSLATIITITAMLVAWLLIRNILGI